MFGKQLKKSTERDIQSNNFVSQCDQMLRESVTNSLQTSELIAESMNLFERNIETGLNGFGPKSFR